MPDDIVKLLDVSATALKASSMAATAHLQIQAMATIIALRKEVQDMKPRIIELRAKPQFFIGGTVAIRELQASLPWTIRYSRDFRANPQPHKDFAHAVNHAMKAIGRLAAFVDDMDHDRDVADMGKANQDMFAKYIADLVVCALRAANTFPGGVVDLERAVFDRIATKNTPAPQTDQERAAAYREREHTKRDRVDALAYAAQTGSVRLDLPATFADVDRAMAARQHGTPRCEFRSPSGLQCGKLPHTEGDHVSVHGTLIG